MLSTLIDGKWQDWNWKRNEVFTGFYLGEMMVGQVFKMRRGKWSAVHRLPSTTGGPVHGFASRGDASAYLDQIERMHREKDNLDK